MTRQPDRYTTITESSPSLADESPENRRYRVTPFGQLRMRTATSLCRNCPATPRATRKQAHAVPVARAGAFIQSHRAPPVGPEAEIARHVVRTCEVPRAILHRVALKRCGRKSPCSRTI